MDYDKWLDDTNGLRSALDENGFNNLLHSVELCIGKKIRETLTHKDIKILESHIEQNIDKNGLYRPKYSRDNFLALMLANKFLGIPLKQKPKLFEMIKGSDYHPRDIVVFGFLYGPRFFRHIMRLFFFIPMLAYLVSAIVKGKIRPKLLELIEEDGKVKKINKKKSRIFFLFKKKELVNTIYTKDGYIKVYRLEDDTLYKVRLHQNDGKILSTLALLELTKHSISMKLFSKVYETILIKKENSEKYMFNMFKNYFKEPNHPVNVTWEKIGRLFT